MIKTEAGEKMKEKNPNKELPEKADINKDGEFQEWEKARHEAIQAARSEDAPEMAMGGLMKEGMGVIVGIEAESGNNIPAGSLPEEVADDIPAMLSEGEYVVPADVVRWHGVKTFEELRCEAKMGMGLMAHDGRIAEVDDETKKPVDYDIEEKDKPKVQKAKVEVIEANEGTMVTPKAPFYRYESRLNPVTNRYEFVPVDATTGETITQETFEQAQSTRYTPQTVLGLAGEEPETQCPDGFEYDEKAGACMPIDRTPMSVTTPMVDGGDGPDLSEQPPVPYAEQFTTKIAEKLGPLSAEELADYEGDTLAEQALSRATDDRTPGLISLGLALAGGVPGIIGLGFRQAYNSVGAKRAMLTRTDELSNWGNITDESLAGNTVMGIQTGDMTYTGPRTYNANFNPGKAAFDVTASSRITGVQQRSDGSGWVTDYQHTDTAGNDVDPFGSDKGFQDALDAIDRDFNSMTAVTGASPGNKGVSVSVTTGDGQDTSSSSTSSVGGGGVFGGGVTGASDMGSPGAGGGGFGGGGSSSSGGTSPGGDVDSGPGGGFGYAKGGYVTKLNKPKVAPMKYSKGSK